MRTITYLAIAVLCCVLGAWAQENATIKLDASGARPRAMEDLTRTAIARDYQRAWQSLTQAYSAGSSSALDAYFVGSARTDLGNAVESQRKIGLQTLYGPQEHSLKAIFYAPEGDLVELQDTVRCQVQVRDANKTIEDRSVVLHYVLLMTPSADRWVIRQMQAVPQF